MEIGDQPHLIRPIFRHIWHVKFSHEFYLVVLEIYMSKVIIYCLDTKILLVKTYEDMVFSATNRFLYSVGTVECTDSANTCMR